MGSDHYTITMTRMDGGFESKFRDVRDVLGIQYLFDTSINLLVSHRQRFRALQEAEIGLEGSVANGVTPYCTSVTYKVSDIPNEILSEEPEIYATTPEDELRIRENTLPEEDHI